MSMRQRSSYSKPFKAQVVQKCLQPGATVSSVAISHGINANVIRNWVPLYRVTQSPRTSFADFTFLLERAQSTGAKE
ncbi:MULTISPECIES: transposase [Pseudomonas]|uniref:transposase n=1 Tax=Pseudomonas sp. FW305-25 TaxID=2070636 RepID=UPI0021150D9A|nr:MULTISPECIES: transposase [Pseudomonas]